MKTITVKGMGRVSVKPDLIVLSMRLETEDKEYDKTMQLADERIEQLNKSLEAVGFEKQAVKTTNFYVRTDYESIRDKNGSYKSVFKGYVCSHNLKVEFDFDTDRLAKALSAISACVAKPEFSISFMVKDPANISAELISIDYNWGEINVNSDTEYKIESRCMMKAEACLSDIDIQPDDVNVNDTATFVWELLK